MSELTYWERLKQLDLQSLQRRRERYTIIHVWKLINNICPNDIKMEFKEHPRLGIRAVIPTLNTQATKAASTLYDNSFAVKAAKLWNILPKHITCNNQLDSFKASLGKFLKSVPDNPPVTGYSTVNSNSILDWHNQKGGLQTAC